MSKELVISATPHETRVAIVEDGQLCEIYIEREKEFALVGSLYKGRVTRVLPGMQSAFVDIGLDSDAFLYVSDFLEHLEDYDHVANPVESQSPRDGTTGRRSVCSVDQRWRGAGTERHCRTTTSRHRGRCFPACRDWPIRSVRCRRTTRASRSAHTAAVRAKTEPRTWRL